MSNSRQDVKFEARYQIRGEARLALDFGRLCFASPHCQFLKHLGYLWFEGELLWGLGITRGAIKFNSHKYTQGLKLTEINPWGEK